MVKTILCAYIMVILLLLAGCGGGGNGSVPLPVNTAIVLSATLKPGLTQTSLPIKGIDVTFTLPAGITPLLVTNGSLQTGETGLKSLNTNGYILPGSYAGSEVHFIILPNDIATTDLGTGEFARLTCNVPSGAQLSKADIQPVYKVSGPLINDSTTDITSEIVPFVRIVTYQKP